MKIASRREYMCSLESVAMTDIVLNMFIFFFISFSLLYTFSKQPGIKIVLPTANATVSEEEKIVIYIGADGEIIFNDQKINIDDIENILRNRLESSQKKSVTLKSDESVNLGLAVRVMDAAKRAGAEGVVIATAENKNGK